MMNFRMLRKGLSTAAVAGALVLGACSDTTGPVEDFGSIGPLFALNDVTLVGPTLPELGFVKVCLFEGPTSEFTVSTSSVVGGFSIANPVTRNLAEGECWTVAQNTSATPASVTVTTPATVTELKLWWQHSPPLGGNIVDTPSPATVAFNDAEGYVFKFKVTAPPPPPPGGDGCTPGFWRQPQHLQYWTGFDPSDLYADVFVVDRAGTLLENVVARGGGANALARHSVAALLNATSTEVNYDLTVAEIIAGVQAAYASGDFETFKNVLEGYNEQGCSVDKSK